MPIAIKVENLSKAYQLGEIGTGTLSNDLKRWAYKVRGKEDPFLKICETNDRTTKGESNMVWSLKDLNFEIEQGDAVGIIGRNGAGKSTLLKILSRVTSPTTGNIKVKGRVASLLEVGTGFHPELTGRDNIFLNGAILGMRKAEIKKHFDAIVDFSGVERYIDTPVKRYSSGMYVRLAFAVAAHLESEILVVDEVLAVGDAEFQKKCLGKMNEVSKGEGRTILFVSHNMAAIKALCHNGIILRNGVQTNNGEVNEIVGLYFKTDGQFGNSKKFDKEFSFTDFTIESIEIRTEERNIEQPLDEYDSIKIITKIDIKTEHKIFQLTYVLKDETSNPIFTFSHINNDFILNKGLNIVECQFPKGFLNIGSYYLDIYIIDENKDTVFKEVDIMAFEILVGTRPLGAWMGKEPGFIKPIFKWNINYK